MGELTQRLMEEIKREMPGAFDPDLGEELVKRIDVFEDDEALRDYLGFGEKEDLPLAFYWHGYEGEEPKKQVGLSKEATKLSPEAMEMLRRHEGESHPMFERIKEEMPSLAKLIEKTTPMGDLASMLMFRYPEAIATGDMWPITRESHAWSYGGGPDEYGKWKKWDLPPYKELDPVWRDLIPLIMSGAAEPRAPGE